MVGAQLCGRRRGVGALQVEHGDPCPVARHEARGREAEAVDAGAASDDDNFVLEKHRIVSRVVWIGRGATCNRLPVAACSTKVLLHRSQWSSGTRMTTSEV